MKIDILNIYLAGFVLLLLAGIGLTVASMGDTAGFIVGAILTGSSGIALIVLISEGYIRKTEDTNPR